MLFNLLKYNLSYFEYIFFFCFLIILICIALLLFSLSYGLLYQDLYSEKISAYECGFQPFNDARGIFEMRFYVIGILFIIFDLELIFIFPWTLGYNEIGGIGLFSLILFFLLLILGFIIEWYKGALEWD